ncbi:hypothetical protein [Leucobacter komagatae]|uniref:hypothetical protein n=1 Tax=Leucobacter komagatae TaxID=55969 RepID=UPI00114E931F|nr:hypothetical protein [Leucobacter komagatae]
MTASKPTTSTLTMLGITVVVCSIIGLAFNDLVIADGTSLVGRAGLFAAVGTALLVVGCVRDARRREQRVETTP